MAAEERVVRRVDVGAGIYVHAPAAAAAAPGGVVAVPATAVDGVPESAQRSRRVPPAALALGTGLAVAALARTGVNSEGLLAAALLVVLTALAAVDLRARVLPNRIIGPALLGVLVWQLAFFTDRVPESLLAAAVAGAFLLLPCMLQPGAMGMGDIKLAALLGLALGGDVIAALTIGFVAVMPVAALLLVLRGNAGRQTAIPFGPFLALGAAVVLLV